jgi:hypothetical protein
MFTGQHVDERFGSLLRRGVVPAVAMKEFHIDKLTPGAQIAFPFSD